MSYQKIILSFVTTIFLLFSTLQLSGCAGATIKVKVKEERPDGTVREFETEILIPPQQPVPPPEGGGEEPCYGTAEECEKEPGLYPTSAGSTYTSDGSDEQFDINNIKFILTANNSIHFNSYAGNLTVKLLNGTSVVSTINSSYYVQGNEIKASDPETVSEWYRQNSINGDIFVISLGDLNYSVDVGEGEIVIETMAIYSSNSLLASNVRSYTYNPSANNPRPPTQRF